MQQNAVFLTIYEGVNITETISNRIRYNNGCHCLPYFETEPGTPLNNADHAGSYDKIFLLSIGYEAPPTTGLR
jgi:hypothetical protein